jgi:hypothetical protein
MKKRTIILGSMIAVFLLLMLPNISAVEYHTVKEVNEEKIEPFLSVFNKLLGKNDVNNILSTNFILLTFIILESFIAFGLIHTLVNFSLSSTESIENVAMRFIASFFILYIGVNCINMLLNIMDSFLIKKLELSSTQQFFLALAPLILAQIYNILKYRSGGAIQKIVNRDLPSIA